jgi:Domain of unknown function (DUF4129)
VAGVAAAVGALVFAVGIGSGRSLAHVGGGRRLVEPGSYSGDLLLFVVAAAVVGAGVIAYVTRPERADDDEEPSDLPGPPPVPWWAEAVTIAIGLATIGGVVAALALFAHHHQEQIPVINTSRGNGSGPGIRPRPVPPGLTPVHWWGIVAAAAVVVASVLIAAQHVLRRPRAADTGETTEEAPEIRKAIALSLDEIEREADPRRAVIRAYARMEEILGRHGLARRPVETSLEHLRRALGALQVSGPSAQRLAALFERAKFSPHDVGGGMKRDAVAALTAVRDELEDAS